MKAGQQKAATQTTETKRADYERIARAMLLMIEMDSNRQSPTLDIESNHEGKDHVLIHAIHEHLFFVYEAIDFYAPDGMELYVEMRLLADRQRARRERENKESTEALSRKEVC